MAFVVKLSLVGVGYSIDTVSANHLLRLYCGSVYALWRPENVSSLQRDGCQAGDRKRYHVSSGIRRLLDRVGEPRKPCRSPRHRVHLFDGNGQCKVLSGHRAKAHSQRI
jgi:hypothetical protein